MKYHIVVVEGKTALNELGVRVQMEVIGDGRILSRLSRGVQALMDSGWEPQGGPFWVEYENSISLCQAMIKRKK